MNRLLILILLAGLSLMMTASSPADALTLDFEILANQRWERTLVPPDFVTEQDLTFQPMTFNFRTEFEPTVISVQDLWDMQPNPNYRTIHTRFSTPNHISLTPFDAEMNAQNVWSLEPLSPSPWYHSYYALDAMQTGSFATSAVFLTYAMHAIDGDRMYHHIVSLRGANSSYPTPASSVDEMAPWTSEMLLNFIDHPQTQWFFQEAGRSEEIYYTGNDVVYTFYDEVFYTGTATLIPEPTTLSLLAFGGLAVLRRKRKRA